MQKYIKEVFKDYNGKNEILDAEIENVNLYKKTNKLQVKVVSKNRITLDDIEDFEKYLVERFKVNGAILDISYDESIEIPEEIEKDWEKIVSYITSKEPMSKALLSTSSVEFDDGKVNVILKMKGTAFLVTQKFDNSFVIDAGGIDSSAFFS